MNYLKKILCIALSAAMMLSVFTVTALAEPTWTVVSDLITSTSHPMWSMKSGWEYYFKLGKSIYSNRNFWFRVPEGAICHLDLNGYQLQKNSGFANCVENNGTLIVTNSGKFGKGIIYNKIDPETGETPAITNNGTLIISDAYLYQYKSEDPANEPGVILNNGVLKLKHCAVGGHIINNGLITGFGKAEGEAADTDGLTDGFYFDDLTYNCANGLSARQTATPKYTSCFYEVKKTSDNYCKVNYHDDGSLIAAICGKVKEGERLVARDLPFGYDKFVKWYLNPGFSGPSYAPGETVSEAASGEINLYGHITEPVVSVKEIKSSLSALHTGHNYEVTDTSASPVSRFESFDAAMQAIKAAGLKQATLKVHGGAINSPLVIDDPKAEITLDLDGRTVLAGGDVLFANVKAGKLYVTNGTLKFASGADGMLVGPEGYLNLTDTNITSDGASGVIKSSGVVVRNGETVNSGLVLQEKSTAIFASVRATLDDTLKFVFEVPASLSASDAGKELSLCYKLGGKSFRVTGEPKDGIYTFAMTDDGLLLFELGSDVEFLIKAGENVITSFNYGGAAYFNELHWAFPEDRLLNTFLADTLEFGNQLRIYEKLEPFSYPDWVRNNLSSYDISQGSRYTVIKQSTGSSRIVSAALNISDSIAIKVGLSAAAGARLVVRGPVINRTVNIGKSISKGIVTIDGLSPLDYAGNIIISLYENSGLKNSIQYNICSYAFDMQDSLGELAVSLYRYAMSAMKYTGINSEKAEHHFGEVEYKWSTQSQTCTAILSCTDDGCDYVITETEKAKKEILIPKRYLSDGTEVGAGYSLTADFENPAFSTQKMDFDPLAKVPNGQTPPDSVKAPEKHLITDGEGNYGGTACGGAYGQGAPLNGALDRVSEDKTTHELLFTSKFYRANDYYNLCSTSQRNLVPHFETYQQTTAVSGIACALASMNYVGIKKTEEELINEYNLLSPAATVGKTQDATAAGLRALFEANGIPAESGSYEKTLGGLSPFAKWVDSCLTSGKLILLRYQDSYDQHWRVIIGHDGLGTPSGVSTSDDVLIMANPFDAYDHYQDGYSVEALSYVYNWWLCRDMLTVGTASKNLKSYHEYVVVDLSGKLPDGNFDFTHVADSADPLLSNPAVPERHILLNKDDTFMGTLDAETYGTRPHENGWKLYEGLYYPMERFEYSYYAYPDIFNLGASAKEQQEGYYFISGMRAFQQTEDSACGLSSNLATLTKYGYDFSNLPAHISERGLNDSILDIEKLADGKHDYMNEEKLEGLTRLYMDYDSYFYNGTAKVNGTNYVIDYSNPATHENRFKNYSGAGVNNIKNVPLKLGFYYSDEKGDYKENGVLSPKYGNYTTNDINKVPFPTYELFKAEVKKQMSSGTPILITWNPTAGHWETITGFFEGDDSSPYDDVIVLTDSTDINDHYADGYNVMPAMQFYSRWFNGSASIGQPYVMYNRQK